MSANAVIHYRRLDGRGTSVYTETLLSDDGVRLQTHAVIPEQYRAPISRGLWELGLLPRTQTFGAIRKSYFYREPFDVLEFFDTAGGFAGYYSDIVTPLTRVDGEYHLTDLFLDVWITPAGAAHELDWDEFDEAVQGGVLSEAQRAHALSALERLRAEIAAGAFPSQYLR
jgi:hypothetical protein